NSVNGKFVKEGFSIVLSRGADIPAFGIGNNYFIAGQIVKDFCKKVPAIRAQGFKKSQVGLVGCAMIFGYIDYRFKELANFFWVSATIIFNDIRKQIQIRIQAYAKD